MHNRNLNNYDREPCKGVGRTEKSASHVKIVGMEESPSSRRLRWTPKWSTLWVSLLVVLIAVSAYFIARVTWNSIAASHQNSYEIIVVDTTGKFTGEVGGIDPDGKFTNTLVPESASQTFTFKGQSVSVDFQNESDSGILVVTIRRNGVDIASRSSDEPHGVVSIETS
jgi:hypothetical protein